MSKRTVDYLLTHGPRDAVGDHAADVQRMQEALREARALLEMLRDGPILQRYGAEETVALLAKWRGTR